MPQSVISEHFTITPENLAKQGVSGQKGVNNNYDKSPFHLPRQYLSFPHGGIRNEKISIRCRTHRPLPDRLRGHQHRGNLERHRESGVSAGKGGAGEAWDLL